MDGDEYVTAEKWLRQRIGQVPKTAIGWFRAGVGFYNKRQFEMSIDCFQESVRIDPLNYNAFQIMARACIALNRRDEAVAALKESVKLENPSDWQLLIELTSGRPGAAVNATLLLAGAQLVGGEQVSAEAAAIAAGIDDQQGGGGSGGVDESELGFSGGARLGDSSGVSTSMQEPQ